MDKAYTIEELKKYSYRHPIVAFDGVCNLCNGFIKHIIRLDKKSIFKFATLQSENGKALYDHIGDDTLDSVLLILDGQVYSHSDVPLLIWKNIGGLYRILYVFILVPKGLRNAIYGFIAKRRYSWFGKREECMIPDASIKSRFDLFN